MKDRLLLVAVVIPILGLLALIGRAEFKLIDGRPWMLRIHGYDPRDLISGHYLRFAYELDWEGSTCGETAAGFGENQLAEGCCLCFSEQSWSPYPGVRQLACDQVDGCLSWTRSRDLAPPQRYFIPEDRGTELEEALRTREAALRVTISDDGTLAIDRLYLDGEPWRP
ncbi:MAG: GDYXXLXY domain-containing protein [Myxococcales bacterium]|nr:GDYXXLXY domain-containing protein [Myxococcales bacterium]